MLLVLAYLYTSGLGDNLFRIFLGLLVWDLFLHLTLRQGIISLLSDRSQIDKHLFLGV